MVDVRSSTEDLSQDERIKIMSVTAPVRTGAMDVAGTNVIGQATMVGALEQAGLDQWNVTKAPMWADLRNISSEHRGIAVPGSFATVGMLRDRVTGERTPTPLGVVGEQYRPVQNEEHAEFMDEVTRVSGATYESVATFKGGRLVYVTMRLPEVVMVGGVDPVNLFMNGINSHDGSTHFMLNLSPERGWCANQLSYFRKNSLKFSHSGNIFEKLELAKRAVQTALDNVKVFGEQAARLVDTDMSVAQFQGVVDQLYPMPAAPGEEGYKARTWNNYTKLRDGIDATLVSPANKDIAGTAWGGLNAVIEYLEWGAGSNPVKQAEKIMTSKDMENKITRAKDLFMTFALAA